ncbi:hypothetical protein K0651_08310 [Ornithinimicrobium sp. Arc0846-15]|nr:hypothetical protein [Ornithinimicrobium laminariae]
MTKLPRNVIRSVPGIGWRDEQLAEQRERLAAQKEELDAQRLEIKKQEKQVAAQAQELAEQSAVLAKSESQLAKSRAKNLRDAEAHEVDIRKTKSETRKFISAATQSTPSFHRSLLSWRRVAPTLTQIDPGHALAYNQIPFKLHNYRLAKSHGIPTPEILAVWESLEDIDLTQMPEKFVLKSDCGASGRGVLPLRKLDTDSFELVDGQAQYTRESAIEHLRGHEEAGNVSGPYFVEGFLDQPEGGPIPDDVKIYAFFGEVTMTLLRHVDTHGLHGDQRRRYVSGAGEDLGRVTSMGEIDASIEVPRDYAQMVAMARHLSRAVGVGFARVDFYQTSSGPVLGEITRAPGGKQTYRPEHDKFMGQTWDEANARLDLDVMRGRPAGRLYGTHEAENIYPQSHWSHGLAEMESRDRVQSCQVWCETGGSTNA